MCPCSKYAEEGQPEKEGCESGTREGRSDDASLALVFPSGGCWTLTLTMLQNARCVTFPRFVYFQKELS